MERLGPLWEKLFAAEQARMICLLVDHVDVGMGGADVRLKLEWLASLARDWACPAFADTVTRLMPLIGTPLPFARE